MLTDAIAWMESHDKLAGWVQAVGALVALAVAFLVAHVQARYAARHEDRRVAERVRSLARTILHWRDICAKSYQLRRFEAERPNVDTLNQNLFEFNHAASEIYKFPYVEAPSELVLRALIKYREQCAPLSNFMSPEYHAPLPAEDLRAFSEAIEDLSKTASGLLAEADRIAR